jgi:hypothetical protein
MGYGVMVILHDTMKYSVMVLHGAENCTKIAASCDHGAIA